MLERRRMTIEVKTTNTMKGEAMYSPLPVGLPQIVDGKPSGHDNSKAQRISAVVMFALCTILLFADQNLMSPNLTAIGNEFGFDAQQRDQKLGGQIALAFFLLGAPASLVVGCLADTYDRTFLFAMTLSIGEGACLATYFTKTFRQLFVCRAITGFSLGGAFPLIFSILGDMFPADQRHLVTAVVGMGTGLGISVGQGIAGFLGPKFGWRIPFAVVSIPALILAFLVMLLVNDPPRGNAEEAVRERLKGGSLVAREESDSPTARNSTIMELPSRSRSASQESTEMTEEGTTVGLVMAQNPSTFDLSTHWATFKSLMSTRTVVLALIQGAPGCVPWGIVNMYLNDFLAQDRGLGVPHATTCILVFGLGNFLGLILGGTGGSLLYRRNKRYPALLAGYMAIFGCLPFWYLLNGVNHSSPAWFIAAVAMLAGTASAVTGPIIKATLQNVTHPRSRGQAFAIFNTFDAVGNGLGPAVVARIILRAGGRTPAFNLGVLGWLLCGVLNTCIFWTVEKDEAKVQAEIASALDSTQTCNLHNS